jgi:hypothetical protein
MMDRTNDMGGVWMLRRPTTILAALVFLALCVSPVFSGCAMSTLEGTILPPNITSVDIPAGNSGETVTWRVEWEGGLAPYTIGINAGGGTQANLPAGTPASSPFKADFELVNGSFYLEEIHAYLVVVTDANGYTAVSQGSYEVQPAEAPKLSIKNLSYDFDSGLLRVIADPDGWDSLLAELTLPAGWIADATERWMEIAGDEAVAEFYIYPEDIIAGAGELGVTVSDPATPAIQSDYDTLVYDSMITLDEGVLAAIPLQRHVLVDGYTYVQVICGDFPPDKPFMYMNGVGVTVDKGAEYVDGTFNVGVRGGSMLDNDGIWANVDGDSFLLPALFIIQENDLGNGRVRIDFNVTPIGGEEVTTGGALFNFALSFDKPGTYTLGFQEYMDVKRTYYSDTNSTEYSWADISNDYPGVPNTITVVAH